MRVNIYKYGTSIGTNGLILSGGAISAELVLAGDPTQPLEAATKQYVDSKVTNLDASGFTVGTIPTFLLPSFSGDFTSVAGSNTLTLSNTGIAAGTYPAVTVDSKGRVIATGTTVPDSEINSGIDWTGITNTPITLAGYGITDGVGNTGYTLQGSLVVPTPTAAGHIANKQYVDGIGVTGSGLTTGDMIRSGIPTALTGFLRCNGSYVSQTTYADLYAVIGDTYGTSVIGLGSGKPWKRQYDINTTNTATDITDWDPGTDLPEPLGFSQAIVTSSRVYLLGGFSGSYVSTVYTAPINADGTLGTWTTGTSLPGPLGRSQAIVTSSRVYLLGGWTGSAYVSTVYTASINADGTLGTWTTGTSLPGPLAESQAIVTSSRVYLLGGYNGTITISTVYTASINADGTLGTWTTETSLPGPLERSQAVVTSSRVYLLGGINSSAYLSTVYTAPINVDGTLGAWTTGTSLPGPLAGSQVIITSSRVYLLGGTNGSGFVSTVYTAPINADGTLGTWATGTSLPGSLAQSQAIVTSSRVCLLGGYSSSGIISTVYTALINADGTLGTWTSGTSLPGPLGASQAIVTSSRVYLLGGYSSSGIISTVYTAPINADGTLGTWTTGTSLPGLLTQSQAVVTSSRVYLLGGHIGATLSTVYTAPINADGTLGAWTIEIYLPGPLAHSQAVVTSSRVYLLGGWNGTAYVSTVYTAPINADGTLGTWTTGTSLPGPLGRSQAIVTSSRVYLLGGWTGSAYVSTVYTAPINADGTLGTWTTGTSLPGPLEQSQAIITSSRVYLLGGYNGSAYTSTVYTAPINADGTLGAWTTGTSLHTPLIQSQAIVTSSRVCLLGGYNGTAYVSTVYSAPFTGGLNNYTSGNATPAGQFTLPDFTTMDSSDNLNTYIRT